MRNTLLAVIFSLFYWSRGISADDDVKRGTFRFMGFIYYQDESVNDGSGARFLQGAVLIRQNFLISSTLVSSISDDPLSKTLLARLGAIRIDANFTFNEDEDEQEQEIVQIIRPITNRTWWAADISLLKTLLPFKVTSAVHVTQLSVRQDYSDKICNIIVFKKKSTRSDGTRFLMPLSVEMLPPSAANCGQHFDNQTMACALDPQGSSSEDKQEDFCQGNSGGPLICDSDVMALQTYIKSNCNPPHLYQLLAPWKTFLACGTENNCNDEKKCPNVCSAILKDSPLTTMGSTTVQLTTESINITTIGTTTKELKTLNVPETTKPPEPSESSETTVTSREESKESTESNVTESTEVKPKAINETAVKSDVAVIIISSSNVSSANDSKPTPSVKALTEGGPEKGKKNATKVVHLTATRRRYHSSSTNMHAIALHGLIFNSLVACICFM